MADIEMAFLWHQHQPYYPDDVTGENPMPWVRLHGVKDYYGMALHLLEFPEMRCTINLVPSLLVQLLAYTDHGASDRFLDVSRVPADGLSEADSLFLLDHFFMANPDHMVLPFPRYAELYRRRAAGRNTAAEALRRFNPADLRDLQVWFNLTWVHPLAFERDDALRELRDKGRNYTEDDKNVLLAKHLEILREVVPLHRRLAESRPGRIDHDAVLPPDSSAIARQKAGARGHARRRPAALHRRLPRRRRRPRPPGDRAARPTVRRAAAGHVAGRGVGVPGDAAAAGRTRRPLDRHRRGDPQRLDPRPRLPRRQGPRQPPRRDVSPLQGPRRRRRAVDRVPRPRHERPDRLSLPAQPARGGGRRLHELPVRDRSGRRRRRSGPGERHPRRRKLLGTLPRRRRGLPPRPVPPLHHHAGRPSHDHRRFPGAPSSARDPAASVRRQLDRPQLRHLDRPRGRQLGLGRPPSRPRAFGTAVVRFGGARRWNGRGENCTSPKAPTGSGGTATTTPAPRTRSSTTCSASTCRTSTCCSATSPAGPGPADQPPSPPRPLHGPARLPRPEDRRPGHFLRVGQRRPLCLPQRTRYDGHGHVRPVGGSVLRLRPGPAADSGRLRRPGADGPGRLRSAARRLRGAGRPRIAAAPPRPSGPGRGTGVRRPAGRRRGRGGGGPDRGGGRAVRRAGRGRGRAGAVFRRGACTTARAATGRRVRGPSPWAGRRPTSSS